MAQILDIADSAVKKHLNKLKEMGVIERVGGTRGYWRIIDWKYQTLFFIVLTIKIMTKIIGGAIT